MTLDVSSALPYGPLERIEVYFEHDGPKFFALRSTSLDVRLFALCTGEDDDAETLDYLYLAMSPQRFQRVRSGAVTLRDAFESAAHSEIWRVVEDYSTNEPSVSAMPIAFDRIPLIDLPDVGARLNIPTPTAQVLDLEELRDRASASHRTFAVLELDATGQNLTEFPIRNLGTIGELFQESVDALAQEEIGQPTVRGAIPAHITADVQMNAVDLRAASFAVVVATDNRGALMDNAPLVEATLMRLINLIAAGHEPDTMIEALRGYGGRARSKVVSLLRAVSDAESGLGVAVTPRSGELTSARLSAREVRAVIQAVSVVKPLERDIPVERGHLVGSNTRTSTFELEEATGKRERYSGKVSEEAIPQIDGLRVGSSSPIVTATIRETVEFSPANPDGGRKYVLRNIAVVDHILLVEGPDETTEQG